MKETAMLQNLIDIIAAPSAMIASSAGGTAVLLPIIFVLYALYLNFVSKFSFVQLGWKSWFSLVCCPPIPAVFCCLPHFFHWPRTC